MNGTGQVSRAEGWATLARVVTSAKLAPGTIAGIGGMWYKSVAGGGVGLSGFGLSYDDRHLRKTRR